MVAFSSGARAALLDVFLVCYGQWKSVAATHATLDLLPRPQHRRKHIFKLIWPTEKLEGACQSVAKRHSVRSAAGSYAHTTITGRNGPAHMSVELESTQLQPMARRIFQYVCARGARIIMSRGYRPCFFRRPFRLSDGRLGWLTTKAGRHNPPLLTIRPRRRILTQRQAPTAHLLS